MGAVAVIANSEKPDTLRLAETAEREIRARGLDAATCVIQSAEALLSISPDLVLVFGGDGTVLGAVAHLGPTPPPILAFNAGRLGYLADNSPERLVETLDDALAGRLQQSDRMMVAARVRRPDGDWTGSALNEFALTSRRHGRPLPVTVWVDEEELMDVWGDGVIVATPTGSTAYALSAGGPVVNPELAALVITPVCPHLLANRSLVLGPEETVTIRHFGDDPVEVMADGRFCLALEREVTIQLKVSSTRVRFLSPPRGRYTLLREKLGWGWRVGK